MEVRQFARTGVTSFPGLRQTSLLGPKDGDLVRIPFQVGATNKINTVRNRRHGGIQANANGLGLAGHGDDEALADDAGGLPAQVNIIAQDVIYIPS